MNDIPKILAEAIEQISSANSTADLEQLRVAYLGKKGRISQLLKLMGSLDQAKRKEVGAAVNGARVQVEELLLNRIDQLQKKEEDIKLSKEWLDVTIDYQGPILPGGIGHRHPLHSIQNRLEDIFLGLGFDVVDGPEVENEYFNFEALNVPNHHPARDMQDTIWTTLPNLLLRTQTSGIQVRSMLQRDPPLRIVAPGRCFRYERLDATHEHTFYQMEGMMIDREVTVGHLLFFMRTLLKEIYGYDTKIRLRPGYFPFVEPGFELDIWFNDRWMELLPCGLVHPKVLEYGGLDPTEWQGFAFGLGLSRLVMSQFGISDIRHMLSGDLRFVSQF